MIRLDRLSVHGFESIRALDNFDPGALTVLIGSNGAGKSNFMDLFRMTARLAARGLRSFVATNDGSDAMLFGGAARTGRIDAAFVFGPDEYRFSLVPAGDRLVFDREETRRRGGGETCVRSLGAGHDESRLDASEETFARRAAGAMAGWRVFHVTVDRKNGESVFQRLDPGRLGEWLEDYALGDLWRMNIVGEAPQCRP